MWKDLGLNVLKKSLGLLLQKAVSALLLLLVLGDIETAKKIFNNILQFKNDNGIFPTGYQYKMDIFWPEENSTWTNAAVIIAAHALATFNKKETSKGNVFFYLNNLLQGDQAINPFN